MEVIPLIKDFPERLNKFLQELNGNLKLKDEGYKDSIDASIGQSKRTLQKKYCNDLKILIEDVKTQTSIDTWARKLHFKSPYKLRKLRALIDIYLVAEQIIYGYDKRYDNFFATILGDGVGQGLTLPGDISVLSWNYDFQLQLSASSFYKTENMEEIDNILNCHPRAYYNRRHNPDEFSLVNLNGIASGYVNTEPQFSFRRVNFNPQNIRGKLSETDRATMIEILMLNYHLFTMPGTDTASSILFAWEGDSLSENTREIAMRETIDTEYLTVIGYSFPTFNRHIDKGILENMKSLKKAYIQIPEPYINEVIARFKALRNNVEVVPITSVGEFWMPFEYEI